MSTFNYQSLVAEAKAAGAETSFEPIPEGNYEVVVEKAEVTPTKKGDPMITLTMKIVEGPHTNRKLWHRMAFIPGNATGLAINFRQLDVMGATPLLENGGSLEQVAGFLKDKRASARVGFGKNAYADKNEVKDIKKSATAAVAVAGVPVPMFGGMTASLDAPRPF